MPLRLVALIVLAPVAFPSLAQTAGWRAYPAYNEVAAVAAAPDGIWAGTPAGVFFYGVPDGEIVTYTSVDGLAGGPVGAMAYDDARGVLWIGYGDGLFERLDAATGTITPFFAIARADQYTARGVRRIRIAGDALYLATDFGVVVFDGAREEVRATYARIGDLPGGTAVSDVLLAPRPGGGDGLWLATDGGVFVAPPDADDLQSPAGWTRVPGAPAPALSLAAFDGTVYVGGGDPDANARDLYRLAPDGSWNRQIFTNNAIVDLHPDGDRLLGVSRRFAYVHRFRDPAGYFIDDRAEAMRAVDVGPGGVPWVGDAAVGLFPLPPENGEDGPIPFDPDPIRPPGPFTNQILQTDIGGDGVLWLVTGRLEAAGTAAVNKFEDGVWTDYLVSDPDLDISRSTFFNGAVGPDGAFYGGAAGGGLTVFGVDESVTTYTPDNSSLQGIPSDPDFVVVPDVGFEGDRRWVVNLSGRPLHLFDADGSWTGLPYPSGIASTAPLGRLAIDGFGQKWFAMEGSGLGVWDTGDDPASAADDRGRTFRDTPQAGQGLPNPDVRDVVVDGRGRVWAGTARGLAYVFSPGSAFGASDDLALPQWPRLADGSDWLLRDVEVNDLDVDPAGQVWVATTTGAYLIDAEGSRVVRQLTSDNSPLPSDAIAAVSVDPVTGRVFLTTREGLFSVSGDATRPAPASDALAVSPSPFRPAATTEGVVVSGLASPQSAVRVLTAAGEVVYAADVAGGSFRWDGRDVRTGRPAPSGVYLVVAAGENGETLYGKVALIR